MCHCVHVYTECVHHIQIKVKLSRNCVFAFIEHLCAFVVEVLIKHGADVNATTEVSHLRIHVHTLQVLCCGYSDM